MVMFIHKGQAVLASHKTPALLLMVMFSHKGEAILVSHKTPALLLMVMFSHKGEAVTKQVSYEKKELFTLCD
jgi:uncharacterized membrane protein